MRGFLSNHVFNWAKNKPSCFEELIYPAAEIRIDFNFGMEWLGRSPEADQFSIKKSVLNKNDINLQDLIWKLNLVFDIGVWYLF